MTKAEAIRAIDRAFWRVAKCCESDSNWERYLDLHREEETRHRKGCPNGVECGLTKSQAVRLFAVQSIFERFATSHDGEKIFTPVAADYFLVRQSIFAAVAIVNVNGLKLTEEFTVQEMSQWLASIDYAELNKDPRHQTHQEAA